MPADLDYREDGTSTVVTAGGQPAWHRDDFHLPDLTSWDGLLVHLPEFGARVERRPIYGMLNGEVTELATHVQNVRRAFTTPAGDKAPEQVVGVVGADRYQCVQMGPMPEDTDEHAADATAYGMVEAMLALKQGEAAITSGGTLRQGAIGFFTVHLGDDYLVPGMESEKRARFVNVINSFDASYALTATNSDVRQVCANTVRWNLRHAPRKLQLRHTGDMAERMTRARQVLGLVDGYARIQARLAEWSIDQPFSDADMEQFLLALVPNPKDKDDQPVTTGRGYSNAVTTRDKMADLWARDPTVAPIRGTRWGAMQTVTLYTNHHLVRRNTKTSTAWDNRFEALVLDDSPQVEAKAARLLNPDEDTLRSLISDAKAPVAVLAS